MSFISPGASAHLLLSGPQALSHVFQATLLPLQVLTKEEVSLAITFGTGLLGKDGLVDPPVDGPGVSPAGVSPAGVSPVGVSPAGVSPLGSCPSGPGPAGPGPDGWWKVTLVTGPCGPTTTVWEVTCGWTNLIL